ncbi:MAG TPA: serine/threonine-protein kinase [Planctomycetota bacterium]|nr:serine/threonine-protein kinase [Planctomycetota bacterium]
MAEPAPHFDDELPAALVDAAAAQLTAIEGSARDAVVRSLAAAHPEHAGALRRLAEDLARTEHLLAAGFPGAAPAAIGPYQVLRRLGAGAFGIVYLAAQQQPIQRQVAIKVLRPGAGDVHTLARFERERQLLAALSHAAIAHVLDAGALPDGRPYFVMEYVDGRSMRSYCDDRQLTVENCLRLFVELCRGVEHAHRRGIVHRDLKPANVLVVDGEQGPTPKIIDFGIAKALHATPPGEAVHTDTGRVIGTPGYMSPEQAAGQVADVDARADVFALGVMLYELLTGELPWGKRPESTDREPPPRPSVRVASDSTTAARRGETDTRRLAMRLRGDLDCIVLKALAHERGHRYQSAHELAADLERHLRGEAVLAQPPSLGSRLRRLARRRRGAFVAAGAFALTLASGSWWSLHYRARAQASESEAEDTRQRLTTAQDRVEQNFGAAEQAARSLLARANDKRLRDMPGTEPVRRMLVQDALDFYDRFLRERPAEPKLREGRARTLETLSRVQWLVGQYEAAATTAREAIAEAEAMLAAAPDNRTYRGVLGHARGALGRALMFSGQQEAAREALRDAVAVYERCYAEDPTRYAACLAETLADWSSVLVRGDDADARLAALRRAVEIGESFVREHGETDADAMAVLPRSYGVLGMHLLMTGNLVEAETALRRAEDLLASMPDADTSQVCALHNTMGLLASASGDHAAAIERYEQGIRTAQHWCEQDASRPVAWQALARLYSAVAIEQNAIGDEQAAADANRDAIAASEACVEKFPADAVARGELAVRLGSFAVSLLTAGRRSVLAEAETCARRGISVLESVPGAVDRDLLLRQRWRSFAQLGFVLDAIGSTDAREHWQRTAEAMDTYQTEAGVTLGDASEFVQATIRLAWHEFEAGLDDTAEQRSKRADDLMREHHLEGRDLELPATELARLAAMLAARRHRPADAAAEAERVLSEHAGWRGALAAADGMRAAWRAAVAAQAEAAVTNAHRDRALDIYELAITALVAEQAEAPDDIWIVVPLGQARIELAELRIDRGERPEAQQLLDEALPALAAVRDEAHANVWDEPLFARGRELAGR